MIIILIVIALFAISGLCLFLYLKRNNRKAGTISLLLYVTAMITAMAGAVMAIMNFN